MSERKFTPGPWIQDGVMIRAKTPLTSIATVLDVAWPCGNVPCDPKANARLIAAAPELLEVIEICLKAERERRAKLLPGAPATTYTQARIDKIEAAIAKATGETK